MKRRKWLALCCALWLPSAMAAHPLWKADLNKGYVLPFSEFKSGNTVNFSAGGLQQGFPVLSYQCNDRRIFINYIWDEKNEYANGNKNYAPAKEIALARVQKMEDFQKITALCTQAPDYRILQQGKDKLIVTDINQISTETNGKIGLWLLYPNQNVLYDLPYNAPFEYKAERVTANCDLKRAAMLHGFDVYQHRVSDAALLAVSAAAIEPQTMRNICSRNHQKLPSYTFKENLSELQIEQKPINDLSALIQSYQLGKPAKTIRQISIGGESTHKNKTEPLNELYLIESTETANIFKVIIKGEGYRSVSYQFLGDWQRLSENTDFGDMKSNDQLVKYRQSKAWPELADGVRFDVSTETLRLNSLFGQYTSKEQQNCQIIQTIRAAKLHPAISGNAKEIECTSKGDQYKRVFTGYFLEDYHYYVHLKTSANAFHWDKRKIVDFK